jgi:hypothetical protein
MEFLLGALAILYCIGLAISGYLVPLIVGGVIGSFFGVAGFGGAVSGMLPGAIIGALVAIAIKRAKSGGVADGVGSDVPPAAPVMRIVECKWCGQKARIPFGRTLDVKCPQCSRQYRVDA